MWLGDGVVVERRRRDAYNVYPDHKWRRGGGRECVLVSRYFRLVLRLFFRSPMGRIQQQQQPLVTAWKTSARPWYYYNIYAFEQPSFRPHPIDKPQKWRYRGYRCCCWEFIRDIAVAVIYRCYTAATAAISSLINGGSFATRVLVYYEPTLSPRLVFTNNLRVPWRFARARVCCTRGSVNERERNG